MKYRYTLIISLLLAASLAVSCAVSPEEDEDASYDRVMKAWMRVNHPGIQPYGSGGAYVLDMSQGSGPAVTDSAYVRIHYTKRYLDQTIADTNLEYLAEQLGTWTVSSWFGGSTWRVDQGYLPDALEEVIKHMRGGGYAQIALPMSASEHDYTAYNAFSSTSESDNFLFEIAVDTVINDIYAYQDQEMKTWFREHYNSASTIEDHLYFKKLVEHSAETDTIPEGNNVNVRYIGRLMNGQVFDTNIEDTAKFYRLWKDGKTYEALSISYYKEDEEQFSSSNSVVDGFGKAIVNMNYGEEAVTLFRSDLGYGEKGSSPAIPEYAPLFFWLYIEPKE